MFADLIIAFLMDRCMRAVWDTSHLIPKQQQPTQVPVGALSPYHHLLPPLFANNRGESSSKCFLDSNEMQAVISSSRVRFAELTNTSP